MDNERFELATMFESIFQLNGSSFIEGDKKFIRLERNSKEPKLMEKIEKSLQMLSSMNIIDKECKCINLSII